MPKSNLLSARSAKNDEFYTQWEVIEKEVQAYLEFNPDVFRGKTILCPCDDPEWSNFTKFFALHFHEYGIKKLISTSYAVESKAYKTDYQLTLFEMNDPKFDKKKTRTKGKLFILDSKGKKKKINIEDLKWDYMEGDGDFRSIELKKLLDGADLVITNPPFSLFREFLSWIIDAKKKFLIIGNINAISYKEVFPLIKKNKMWLGPSITRGDREFEIPKGIVDKNKFTGKIRNGKYFQKVVGVRWFTNLDHGRRHQPLSLMSIQENLKHSKHKEINGKDSYYKYDNFNAIEVPFIDAIPSDYNGIMGVPISFLDKYCPDQFVIIGQGQGNLYRELSSKGLKKDFVDNYYKTGGTGSIKEDHPVLGYYDKKGKAVIPYMRILIKRKRRKTNGNRTKKIQSK